MHVTHSLRRVSSTGLERVMSGSTPCWQPSSRPGTLNTYIGQWGEADAEEAGHVRVVQGGHEGGLLRQSVPACPVQRPCWVCMHAQADRYLDRHNGLSPASRKNLHACAPRRVGVRLIRPAYSYGAVLPRRAPLLHLQACKVCGGVNESCATRPAREPSSSRALRSAPW